MGLVSRFVASPRFRHALAGLLATAACNQPAPPNTAGSQTSENPPPSAALASRAPAAEATPAASFKLTFATWNLQWLSRDNNRGPVARNAAAFARLGTYAKRLSADIVAVQEVESVEALARVFDPERYAFHVTRDASTQRTGFAYRKDLPVQLHPDYTALNAGQLRSGADIALSWGGTSLRLLSVHLKSGCFGKPLGSSHACNKLAAQVPTLEAWLDERAAEGVPFAVLGDFNRRLFASEGDQVWRALDDQHPPESDLFSPTAGRRSECWGGNHPQYIDHLVFSRTATKWLSTGSFRQLTYDASDRKHRRVLSDHCPLAVTLNVPGTLPTTEVAARSDRFSPPLTSSPATSALEPTSTRTATSPSSGVKGNRSRSGKRYYHTPDCPNYDAVKVDPAKGEFTFPDVTSAEAAGFRRSPDCPRR